MLKTIKGKVIAGTVSVVLLSSAGVAFANTDAGDKLQTWYNNQFLDAKGDTIDGVASHVNSKIDGLTTEYNGLKSDATASINGTRDSSTTRAGNAINSASQVYIDDLNSQKAAISANMETQFNALSVFADGLIDEAGVLAEGYARTNLTEHTGNVGGAAVTKVTSDLDGTKATAKAALATAISTAKSDLENQLESETSATVIEINGMIDAKIIELRGTITGIKNALVKDQQDLINAEALRQLNAAKAELEAVANGI